MEYLHLNKEWLFMTCCNFAMISFSLVGDELQSDSLSETSARCIPYRRRRHRAPGELPPPLPSDDVPSLNPQFVCAFAQCNSWSTDSETSFKLHCMSRHFKHRPMFCYMCSAPLPDEDVLIVHIKATHPQVCRSRTKRHITLPT